MASKNRTLSGSWSEASVDSTRDYFELRFGSADTSDWTSWVPVARVARQSGRRFRVEFLLAPQTPEHLAMNAAMKKELDFLKFQLDEIVKADIKDSNEDEALNREYEILRNAAGLKEISGGLFSGLYEDDSSFIGKLSGVEKGIAELSKYEPLFAEHHKNIGEMICQLKAAAEDLRAFRDKVEINEERLGEVDQRIIIIERLKKKYGGKAAIVGAR